MQILIVEDDRPIAENLHDYLEARGHQCDHAATLAQARRRLAAAPPDVLLLDRSLPDGDGLALVHSLRAQGSSLPVLVLSARETLDDRLRGFEAGSDDYLVKPFALQEVEARLLSLLRRAAPAPTATTLELGPLRYDAAAQELRLEGRTLPLPPKPLRLAALLIEHPNRVFSRQELETAVWGQALESSDNLRSVLHTLRRALADAAGIEIVNVHGLGYKLVVR
ncbi:response regulator transcription factor [uncultured Methylibium sp.]|uniref:response regulator transcription factor n=1 Tax=uncultured Methylibium sp. TaxID=381093 RepID=UPI0025EA76F0|nr:response regulator transcription factor [uncultured Methylibium sp.]